MTQLVCRDEAIDWLMWAGVINEDDINAIDAELDEMVLDSIQFGDDDEVIAPSCDEEETEDLCLDWDQFGGHVEYDGPDLEPIDIYFEPDCVMWEAPALHYFEPDCVMWEAPALHYFAFTQ